MNSEQLDFPLAKQLGMRIDVPEPGRALATLQVDARHLNPHGVVHGAVHFAMVDTAMGAAVLSVLDADLQCASTDVQIRFVAGVRQGALEAAVQVSHQGTRNIVLDGRVMNGSGDLVALATGTFAVLRPR